MEVILLILKFWMFSFVKMFEVVVLVDCYFCMVFMEGGFILGVVGVGSG